MKQARLTEHFMNDRVDRYLTIATKVGFGETIKSVYVNDERNGEAIHHLTTTGVIFIQSVRTNKMVTLYVASPGQVKKIYGNETPPVSLIKIAKRNEKKGWTNLN